MINETTENEQDIIPGIFFIDQQQFDNFLTDINKTCRCLTQDCNGILVPEKVATERRGGGLHAIFKCSGCSARKVHLNPTLVYGSKRLLITQSTCVAFICGGLSYAQYNRVIGQCMGMQSVSRPTFQDVLESMYEPVKQLIDSMCEDQKQDMEQMDQTVQGSMSRGVTTSDGVYLTRGCFSKNMTFTLWNYLTGGIIYYVHLSMRGNDDIVEEDLFEGTAKSAEGYAAEKVFNKAKEEGLFIEVNWQDADSSSGKAFEECFPPPQSKNMLCGGHVNRAHTKCLSEFQKQKQVSATFKAEHRKDFPAIDTAVCSCAKKGRHHKNCGCMNDSFLKQSRINFFCALLEAEKSPERFESILLELSQHHIKNEHVWDGGKCSFHDHLVCSCETEPHCQLEEGKEKCAGKPYVTRNTLTCELHQLLYEIDIWRRAKVKDRIIDRDMGKGHSNLPEMAHNVLLVFRTKNQNLQRLHYALSTNLGLLQANMTWAMKRYGPEYHWLMELYQKMNMPVFPGVVDALKASNEERIKNTEKYRSAEYKKQKVTYKRARALEQADRRKWNATRKIKHYYGEKTDGDENTGNGSDIEESSDSESEEPTGSSSTVPNVSERNFTNIGTERANRAKGVKKCRCGATDHQRVSFKSCPLNPKNVQSLDL